MKSKLSHLFLFVLVGVICMQVLLMSRTPEVAALPPRPTATPAALESAKPKGGLIELQVKGVLPAFWTLVQWQDAQDDWHDVVGWQGTLDEGNVKTWWVGEADLGTGPFRWVALDKGDSVWISNPFYLPVNPGEKVVVTLLLD
jgi:hypothetical protein